MINVILTGGLGNIFFQYALGRHLAIKNGTDLRLILTHQMSKHDFFASRITNELEKFKIEAVLYRPMVSKVLNFIGQGSLIDRDFIFEKQWGFDRDILLLKNGCYLKGLFQSEKYFKDIESVIRSDLQFKTLFSDTITSEMHEVMDKIINSNSVFLHVRRGDYLTTDGLNICDIGYYYQAIKHLMDKIEYPNFFVFSNDIEWCEKNFHLKNINFNFVNLKQAKTEPLIDFYLMRLCKHGVIPNSTFSWWAAWLIDNPHKVIVAPNKWFSHDEAANSLAIRDTIPGGWVRINL